MFFYVYVLQNKEGRRYVGSTTDLVRRLKEHNAGQNIATKPHIPWEIIFYEAYRSREDGLRREKYLKTTQGRRSLKKMLECFDNQ